MSLSPRRDKIIATEDDIPAAVAIEHSPTAENNVLSISDLPLYERTDEGSVTGALMVDYWSYEGEKLVLSGWISGTRCHEASTSNFPSMKENIRTFRRPDVEAAHPNLSETSRGFLAVLPIGDCATFDLFGHKFLSPGRTEKLIPSQQVWQDHRSRLGFLLRTNAVGPVQLAQIASQLEGAPAGQRARGYLEQAKGVVGCGGVVVGWLVELPGMRTALADSYGNLEWLDNAVRWHRTDIVEAFGGQFGNFTFNAGFLQSWRHPFNYGDTLRLIAVDGDSCYMLETIQWSAAPAEPISFARWAFDFPAPLDLFFDRLERHDGPIIEALISSRLESRTAERLEVLDIGKQVPEPVCSVIVPLYGRFEFMMNQLLELSEDREFKDMAELVYVVDDPRILSQVKQQAWLLYEANQVPFKIVSSGGNRGFSGANNLGVSISRAPYILLINSDVIPVEPGWLRKMVNAIESSSNAGIVGARLLYPNGSIQHDGMTFVWEPSWNAYLNKHPRAGLEPLGPISDKPSRRIAVTAACLLLRRSTYNLIRGLDEGFLIGDFEDSDLCFKVRELGLDILIVTNVHLIHLERQSFQGIGLDRFREQVARFNAWRHQRRWGDRIPALLEEFKGIL